MENASLANVTAKVDKNAQRVNRLDKIISSIEKMGGMGPHEFLHEVINAMMLSENTSTRHSRYAKLGGGVTLRLADHYGVASNFKIHNSLKNNYGLVIKLSNHRYKSDRDVDYLEYVYFPDKLNKERQLEILTGLKGFIETGRFDLLPTPDKVHPSGKFNNPEIRFRSIAADSRTADSALDTIEQATADYADTLNTERGAIIDAITPAPGDSLCTILSTDYEIGDTTRDLSPTKNAHLFGHQSIFISSKYTTQAITSFIYR